MKLVANLSSLEELDNVLRFADVVMAGNDAISPTLSRSFSIPQLIYIANKAIEEQKQFMLQMDLMFFDNDRDVVNNYIETFKAYGWFYVSDLGMVNLLISKNLGYKTIYNPRTLLTNYADFNAYEGLVMAAGISNEITIADVKEIADKKELGAFYQGFGFTLMMHSRRKLVSLYEEKYQVSLPSSSLYLTEATRDSEYPIVENSMGTMIYRSYALNVMKEINNLHQIDFLFLNHTFIPDQKFLAVLMLYFELNNNNIAIEKALEVFELLRIPFEEGFMYQDTVYVKEPNLR